MSGNAALSAARKRRASSSPGAPGSGSGIAGGFQQPNGSSYYAGNSIQNIQAMMNQSALGKPGGGRGGLPPVLEAPQGPQIPINVYENIELIKQQIEQRVKLIQTQGSTMPPEKLRILHKQNEVQTQILKQRMLMVQEMEMVASMQPKMNSPVKVTAQPAQASSSQNEPQFIYEKGIPRQNPRYGVSNVVVENTANNTPQPVLTPFVSMVTSTGATPPPLVILKSHDEKIGEHDNVLNDLVNRVDYIHSRLDELSQNNRKDRASAGPTADHDADPGATDAADADADADAADAEEDETVLLMDTVMNDLINSRDFVQGIVDKIVNETNLSETILKVEPIIKENQELRSLIHSQQKMLNEMNTMVMRLLNQQHNYVHAEADADVDTDADADCHSISISLSHSMSNDSNEQSKIDDNGLYHNVSSDDPVDNDVSIFIVPDMSHAVMSESIKNDATEVNDPTEEATEEPTQMHHEDEEYENTSPHFPVDSRIALVINEI
jgi:hypothetical protein